MVNCKFVAIDYNDQATIFEKTCAYLDLNNDGLANMAVHWNLLDSKNLQDNSIISSYLPWSYTVSFLYMVNAWQWFFSGVLLSRQTYLPAQILQTWYYSKFFASLSFLASHFKGIYTVEIKERNDPNVIGHSRTRRAIWFENSDPKKNCLALDNIQPRGGQHEIIAYWFYEVFNNWDKKHEYPDVAAFINDRKFHTYFRNLYTYSLADIAEELFSSDNQLHLDNDLIIELWKRNVKAVEIFPDAFWTIEHLKLVTNLHVQFIATKDKPLKNSQNLLLQGLYRLHKKTTLDNILNVVFKGIVK